MRTIKIAFTSIIIFALFAPSLSYGTSLLGQPKNLNEVKQVSEKAINIGQKEIPRTIKEAWQNEILPVWQKMFDWAKNHFWKNKLDSGFKNFWQSVKRILKVEVKQRKPTIEQNFQAEKQGLKKEAPQVGQSLWEKFKKLIK